MDEEQVVEPSKEVTGEAPKDNKPPEDVMPKTEPQKNGNGKNVIAFAKGGLQPKNFDDLWKMASLMYRAAVAPKKAGFDSVEKVAAAMEYCSKMGLIFQASVGNLCFINDRLTVWGDLPSAIARQSGQLEKLDTLCFDKDYKEINLANKNLHEDPFVYVTTIKRKDQPEKQYHFSKKDAERAGLMKKDIWIYYWPIMMRRKSIGMALKFEMADVLMGLGIAEYDFDTAPDLKDVTPQNTPSTENYIQDKYGREPIVQSVAPQLPGVEAEKPNPGALPLTPGPAVVS